MQNSCCYWFIAMINFIAIVELQLMTIILVMKDRGVIAKKNPALLLLHYCFITFDVPSCLLVRLKGFFLQQS